MQAIIQFPYLNTVRLSGKQLTIRVSDSLGSFSEFQHTFRVSCLTERGGFDPTNHRKTASIAGRESKYSHISTPTCALETSSAASHIIFGILMSLLVGLRRICSYRYPERPTVKATIISPCNSRQSRATCHQLNVVVFVVL